MFRKFKITILLIFLMVPAVISSDSFGETLNDDVVAMITSARKIPHTVFLLDTSEAMNTFAYSDYLKTCADAKKKINHSISLCESAFNQCENVEKNASCSVDLGCDDIKADCLELQTTKVDIDGFCTKVEIIYAEPGKTDVIANPMTGDNDAKKFVGPWDPRRNDYELDLCFYSWTSDTGGDVMSGTSSGHYSNEPEPGNEHPTDRRDWDCLTDGSSPVEELGGLWLNWKYATALDAMKIVLANRHKFAFAPRTRGERECIETDYFPVYDTVDGKRACVADLDPDVVADSESAANEIRSTWNKDAHPPEDIDGGVCDTPMRKESGLSDPHPTNTADSLSCDICKKYDLRVCTSNVMCPDGYSCSCDSGSGCSIGVKGSCEDGSGDDFKELRTVSCEEYVPVKTDTEDTNVSVDVETEYICCNQFKCDDPVCRDDDKTCESEGSACLLGYYDKFDEYVGHCCTVDDFHCVSVSANPADDCTTGGQYVPGAQASKTVENSLNMSFDGGDEYKNATLTIELNDINTTGHVDAVRIRSFYGCDDASTPGKELFDTGKTDIADILTMDLGSDVILEGCETEGYKVNLTAYVYHSGADYGSAEVDVDVEYTVKYDSGSMEFIDVLNYNEPFFEEGRSEIDPDTTTVVNEYECKTTMYHKQSLIVTGGTSNCNDRWDEIVLPDGSNPSNCVHGDHKVIAADQWGNAEKSACSWLCRDQEEYDDVWKCRAFFAQMDTVEHGGSNACADICYDTSNSLEDCCECINNNNATYNYMQLEDCPAVDFDSDITSPTYKCCSSGYKRGETSDGDLTYIAAYQTVITEGHIKEADGGAYRLNIAGYTSPYDSPSGTGWYRDASLISRSDNYLTNSYVSIFETSPSSDRKNVCIYDIISDYSGTDCDTCGTGCCEVDIGGGEDQCDYPAFWMQMPHSYGGRLLQDATVVTGAVKENFQNLIAGVTLPTEYDPSAPGAIPKKLVPTGGATIGETLYDIWRYIGGMQSAHDPSYKATPYNSPIKADPECFLNEVVIISGGQPNFDSNEAITTQTTQSLPGSVPQPFVSTSETEPTLSDPYYRSDWFATSLENVASFVTSQDAYHTETPCREDKNVNMYGFQGDSTGGIVCDDSTDDTGRNRIDKIHTVAIGEWVLGALYTSPEHDYLETSVLQNAARNYPADVDAEDRGYFYGLTSKTPSSSGAVKTFENLTDLFNEFSKEGSDQDRQSGRPQFSSPFVQAYGPHYTDRATGSYLPVGVPVSNNISRFWIGNLKKYFLSENTLSCSSCDYTLDELDDTPGSDLMEYSFETYNDCFTDDGNQSDIDESFRKTLAAGAAKLLADRLLAAPPTCGNSQGSECYTSGVRTIYFDMAASSMERLSDASKGSAEFNYIKNNMMGVDNDEDAAAVLNYIYGYDAFDDDGDGAYSEVRDWNSSSQNTKINTVEIQNPFEMSFDDGDMMDIRPTHLGAIVHSNPIAVHYEDQCTTRIFAGANDGMLHSFSESGRETFAYLPAPIIERGTLGTLLNPTDGFFFRSFVDGPMTLFHIDTNEDGVINSGETALLIFGYRRGANKYTVLDISQLDNPEVVQHIEVEGESWSKPVVFNKSGNYYLTFGGGYDSCYDNTTPLCPLDASSHPNPDGNRVYVFKYDSAQNKFETPALKDITYTSSDPNVHNPQWLVASIVASPMAVNTSGFLHKNTEFVYFIDVTSTVFRLDVRNNDPSNWEFRPVIRFRSNPPTINWGGGIRVYNSFIKSPPMMQYLRDADNNGKDRIPIPFATGNITNPKDKGAVNEAIVFYDWYNWGEANDPNNPMMPNLLNANTIQPHSEGLLNNHNGWLVQFNTNLPENSEKSMSSPLVWFWGETCSAYTLVWTTYVPAAFGECTAYGTSRLYIRNLANGSAPNPCTNIPEPTGEPFYDLGEGLARGAQTAKGAPGHPIQISVDDRIMTFEEKPAQAAPVKILKWYEFY